MLFAALLACKKKSTADDFFSGRGGGGISIRHEARYPRRLRIAQCPVPARIPRDRDRPHRSLLVGQSRDFDFESPIERGQI